MRDFVAADGNQRKGEIVLLVSGLDRKRADDELSAETSALLLRLAREMPARKASAVVADLTGLRKKHLYDYLLEHAKRDDAQ